MADAPLISVIIPTFNNGPVVCQAIDCALNQTYENLEVIVVDDGSSDNTMAMLERTYQDRIISVRQENRGAGSARNTGIRHASGHYVQFLDADDLLDPDKLRIQMTELRNTPGKAVSYCDYLVCDMDKQPVNFRHVSPVLHPDKPYDDIILKWETDLCIPIHCFLFDMVFFREFGIAFDEGLSANEDWDCWMNIFALEPALFFVDQVLAYYRVRPDSRCRDRVKMRNSYLRAIDTQIQKNSVNGEIVGKLKFRKKQIKSLYKNESPLVKLLERLHPAIKNLYTECVPWRIQRIFD